MTHEVVNWRYQSGGADSWSGEGNSDCVPISSSGTTSLAGGYNGYSPTWEIKTFSGSSYEVPFWVYMIYIDTWAYIPYWSTESWNGDAHACVMIVPSGQAAIGTTALYLVQAQVMDEDSGLQISGNELQIRGTMLTDVTNDDGSVWSYALVSGPSGAPVETTPKASVPNISYNGMQVQVVHLSIIDSNSGVDLTLQTNTVIVGQQMNWYCQLCLTNYGLTNPPLSNFQWTVPGYVISNYVVAADASSAVVVTNFPLNNSNVVFYWVDGASNRTVQCSAMVNGATVTGQGAFNVLRPTATITATTSSVGIYDIFNPPWLQFFDESSFQEGITFSGTMTIPFGFSGTNEWVQIVLNPYRALHNTNGVWWVLADNGSGPYLDTSYPYTNVTANVAIDSPGTPLLNGYNEVTVTNRFKMWLMFKPTGGLWVPLKTVTWNWSGTALLSGTNWVLANRSWSTNPPDADAGTIFPQWNNNVRNLTYQAQP